MKKGIKISVGVLVLSSLYLLTWISLAPMNSLRELEQNARQSDEFSKIDSSFESSSLVILTREKAYKKSLTSLLNTDSIHLIINVHDTLIGLFINGIMVHRSKPTLIQMDQVLKKLSNRAYLAYFSNPVQIMYDTASIVKEPIVVREAPKDTLEASLNAYKPDTLIQNPAFWRITLPQNIHINFSQINNTTPLDIKIRSEFYGTFNAQLRSENFRRFMSFDRAVQFNTIDIELSAEDLRAVYRAIPNNSKIIVRF